MLSGEHFNILYFEIDGVIYEYTQSKNRKSLQD
jgi:hypothetical protein